MDEVQSWWEVPAVAHFCYVFRDAFNLIYFEIAELEAAILNEQDPEMCVSLEQLIMRLLQGCFEENVTYENWEEKLHELFKENCSEEENPIEGASFHFLSPRIKVEVLHKLCEFRIDVEGALGEIKDIPAEDMKASCVGKDSQNKLYWYFCDERLYIEDPSVSASKPRKCDLPAKGKNVKNSTVKNGRRSTTRERKTKQPECNKPWSIVCNNLSDWETLLKTFSKSKSANEKELVNKIKNEYLPILKEVVAEKDRLLRKRFLELAPKRASSRICKVQAQRKLEEQMAAEAAENRRLEQEKEQARKEAEKKKIEREGRQKRTEERRKIIQERSIRAKQREMMRGYDSDSDIDANPGETSSSRSQRICRFKPSFNGQNSNNSSGSDEKNSDASSDENETAVTSNVNYRSESSSSSKDSSRNQSEDNSSDEESDKNSSANISTPPMSVSSSSRNKIEQTDFASTPNVQNTSNLSRWTSQVDSKGHRIHILQPQFDELPETKRLKLNEVSSYNMKKVNTIPIKDTKPTYYQSNHKWYLNSCAKVTQSPSIIRLDFIKPPAKHSVSN